MLRHDYKPLIFLINNRGYTIERTIMGKDDPYNDVANWHYTRLPQVFAPDTASEAVLVRTNDELRAVLDAPHPEFLLVETLMEKDDAPDSLIRNGHELAAQDFGPRGPQNEPGARIALPGPQVAVHAG